MLVRISGVHPCNLLADWELWLTAAAQHHKMAPYRTRVSGGRCCKFYPN